MLRDIERKVLRILWNFNAGRKGMPTLHELSVKTGKIEPEIKKIIQLLADQRYLEWDGDDMRTIMIINGWERNTATKSAALWGSDYSRFL